MSKANVSIVSMPWGMIQEPALGPSILAASLRNKGHTAKVHYFQHKLLRYLSYESYCRLADVFAINDFLFSKSIDQQFDEIQSTMLDKITQQLWEFNAKWYNDDRFSGSISIREYLLKIRDDVIPDLLNECVEAVLIEGSQLVAFSCLYDQTISSLALAKLIKERQPNIQVIMGGYAVRGPIASHIAEKFDWIDSVIEGPGEDIIIDFAQSLNSSQAGNISCELTGAIEAHSLIENSPKPDYSDFKVSLDQLSDNEGIDVDWRVVPYESSRGCWWGSKSHCIFCGIKSEDLSYSYKDEKKVLSELSDLSARYEKTVFRFVDYIIPIDYFETLFPALRVQNKSLRLTCETKSNLSVERIRALAASGFAEVQPGIESFSTSSLKGMRKGVTAAQNVSFIRTAFEEGMIVHYNLLYGFKFDTVDDIQKITESIALLHHLPPPATVVEVLTTRFSPMQEQGYSIGRPSLKAHQHYDVVFSRAMIDSTGFDVSKYCYYFESLISHGDELQTAYAELLFAANNWSQSYYVKKSAYLLYEETERGVSIFDSRFSSVCSYNLSTDQSKVLRICLDGPYNVTTLKRKMDMGKEAVQVVVDELIALRLLFCESGMFTALPINRKCISENYAMDMRDRVAA